MGGVNVAADGDVFGKAVNLAARIEKVAQAGAVCFTDAVRAAFARAEIPHEPAGSVELKGMPDPQRPHRTTFERSPVANERALLVVTDFAGVLRLADRDGRGVIHPVVDDAMGRIVRAARARRGGADGCGRRQPAVVHVDRRRAGRDRRDRRRHRRRP